MRLGQRPVLRRQVAQPTEMAVEDLHLVFAQILDVDEPVTRPLDGGDQLVQLQMDRLRVLVLGSLDEENHQKRNDGRRRVDDQLPTVERRFRPADEQRVCEEPDDDRPDGDCEGPGAAGPVGGPAGEVFEYSGFMGHGWILSESE